MTQISILGCGWLGLPLAKTLLENGFSIKGSTTSAEKISVMENLGIQPHLVVLDHKAGEETGNLTGFLENSKILIIDIPPKLRENPKESSTASSKTFVEKIQNLTPFIEKSGVEKVLFISSTSVYGNTSELELAQDSKSIVTEETKACPETESGKQLLETEQLLQSNPNFATTVLRFGGLIGEDRHPVKFLAGRTNIENPKAPINLIHQDDCIGIIKAILCHPEPAEVWNQVFNAVTPFHPDRKDYYTQKAIDLNLDLPGFTAENSSFGKVLSSSKIEKVLAYQFARPSL